MERAVEAQTVLKRLDALLKAAVHILQENPELAIERVSINEFGVHSLYKVPGFSDVLPTLIRGHSEAFAAWTATVGSSGELVAEGQAFERLVSAELNFITHQCRGDHEVQIKLAYVAECRSMRDSILGDIHEDGTSYQTLFLNSLSLPVDAAKGMAPAK